MKDPGPDTARRMMTIYTSSMESTDTSQPGTGSQDRGRQIFCLHPNMTQAT